MRHQLKIWPVYFARVLEGSKTFEVRKNDRGFQVGDTVQLQEFVPEESKIWLGQHVEQDAGFYRPGHQRFNGYTGRDVTVEITYVLPIDEERVVFSFKKCGENLQKESES